MRWATWPRAQQFLGQAEQLDVAYDGPGDSPQSVAESIRQGQELAELRKSPAAALAWRQTYAKFLVEQADALLSWNDLDTATRAANEAAQLNPQFPARRRDAAGRAAAHRRSPRRRPRADSGRGARGRTTLTIADAKAQTLDLLAQARAALGGGRSGRRPKRWPARPAR